MPELTDVDVISEEVGNFASAGTGYDDSALRGLLAPGICSSGLPGCEKFKQADQEVTTLLMELSTRVEQLLNGVRQGANKIAHLYDDMDQAVYEAQQKVTRLSEVAPQEQGLPTIDPDLAAARTAGDTASRLDAIS